MRAALSRHDVLFEAAVREHGGVHIRPRGEGDSRFAVFASAIDAAGCALAVQRAFLAEPWPTPSPIKVRIGLHTGEAQLREGDYYGSTVNRYARLRNIGHGGQTLLSEATEALVRDALSDGGEVRDLGLHRLRDLTQPERVFQLSAPDLSSAFPAPASLDARSHNLPMHRSALVGREREIAEIRALLLRPDIGTGSPRRLDANISPKTWMSLRTRPRRPADGGSAGRFDHPPDGRGRPARARSVRRRRRPSPQRHDRAGPPPARRQWLPGRLAGRWPAQWAVGAARRDRGHRAAGAPGTGRRGRSSTT